MISLERTIAIKGVSVVDGISIKKENVFHRFGYCPTSANQHCGSNERMTLDADEKVQSITYGRSSTNIFRNLICRLRFHTNKRVLGPFSNHSCHHTIYRVDIPSEMMLEDYFNQYTKTKSAPTSFGTFPFFDGFTSEYSYGREDWIIGFQVPSK